MVLLRQRHVIRFFYLYLNEMIDLTDDIWLFASSKCIDAMRIKSQVPEENRVAKVFYVFCGVENVVLLFD